MKIVIEINNCSECPFKYTEGDNFGNVLFVACSKDNHLLCYAKLSGPIINGNGMNKNIPIRKTKAKEEIRKL